MYWTYNTIAPLLVGLFSVYLCLFTNTQPIGLILSVVGLIWSIANLISLVLELRANKKRNNL